MDARVLENLIASGLFVFCIYADCLLLGVAFTVRGVQFVCEPSEQRSAFPRFGG